MEQPMEDKELNFSTSSGGDTDNAAANKYKSNDLPICSVCDTVSLDCTPLPTCSHPACPKCLAIAKLQSEDGAASTCRTCLEEESSNSKTASTKKAEQKSASSELDSKTASMEMARQKSASSEVDAKTASIEMPGQKSASSDVDTKTASIEIAGQKSASSEVDAKTASMEMARQKSASSEVDAKTASIEMPGQKSASSDVDTKTASIEIAGQKSASSKVDSKTASIEMAGQKSASSEVDAKTASIEMAGQKSASSEVDSKTASMEMAGQKSASSEVDAKTASIEMAGQKSASSEVDSKTASMEMAGQKSAPPEVPQTRALKDELAAASGSQAEGKVAGQSDQAKKSVPRQDVKEGSSEKGAALKSTQNLQRLEKSAQRLSSVMEMGRPRAISAPVDPSTLKLKRPLPTEKKDPTLSDRVLKIQEALSLATKYTHCHACLQAKKSAAPESLCLNCALSFCQRCTNKHKEIFSGDEHMMVPVAPGRRNSFARRNSYKSAQSSGPSCPKHNGAERSMYCRNCETLACTECVAEEHEECVLIVSSKTHATEERAAMKQCRVKYAQVMRFFTEQRRGTEESLAALLMKKRDFQGDVRKFFSVLIKACMDVEGALLEELETSVSDHTDLLKDQSSLWLALQESTQQLLDITDMVHFIPMADFLPISAACKEALGHALRAGEMLAATTPPQMHLNLDLEQSSQRSVVKRIKEIGATALTVSTHNTLTLRKLTTVSFSGPSDKEEPLVTAMLLLSQTQLVAADFNNSCLKLFRKDEGVDTWHIAQILPLKWRPYDIVKLSEESVYSPKAGQSGDESKASLADLKGAKEEGGFFSSSYPPIRRVSLERQAAVVLDDEDMTSSADATSVMVQAIVSSPYAGCFTVELPVLGTRRMRLIRRISEDKGCWGITLLDEHHLAVSTVDAGRSFIIVVDMATNARQRLPLTTKSTLAPLVSPRHLIATSPSTILVCDHGKKAIIHVSTDGTILFTYTGHGNEKLSRPEGLCLGSQDRVYIADSVDNSLSVISKSGHIYSKTSSQQGDINGPQAVYVDRNSCLYISNDGGKLLAVYDIIPEAKPKG